MAQLVTWDLELDGELEHPRYHNIRQMKLLMAEGRLTDHGRSNGHAIQQKQAAVLESTR